MPWQQWRSNVFSLLLFLQSVTFGLAIDASAAPLGAGLFGVMAVLALVAWLSAWRLARAILDTPTSRVASAAQGYVELHGEALPHAGLELLTPHTQLPCLWYRYRVERREDNKWRHVDGAESDSPFDLADGSGRCRIEPRGAHVQTTHREVRREGEYRHTEEVLLKHDRLYALGGFSSHRVNPVQDLQAATNALLTEWKADQPALHARFDLDQDGEIGAQEWALARAAARREARQRLHAQSREGARHTLGTPAGGQPFIVSNLSPDALGGRYRLYSRVFLGMALAALGAAAWVLKTGPG